jgi:hypothetical protein
MLHAHHHRHWCCPAFAEPHLSVIFVPISWSTTLLHTYKMKTLVMAIALQGVLTPVVGNTVNYIPCDPTVTIDGGTIVGTTTSIQGTSINQFLGIPFASAPTGAQRFSPPIPTTWSDPLDTKAFKPACIQVFNPFESRDFVQDVFSVPRPEESEDCLYLNVFAPPKKQGVLYPVMFWMYGGGFKFGNAGQPIYDGSHFAALEDVRTIPSQKTWKVSLLQEILAST